MIFEFQHIFPWEKFKTQKAYLIIIMNWITREKPKIDRIASPWLIKKFVDKEAVFFFVPFEKVMETSEIYKGTPFDIPGVEYTHYGEETTFDYILKKYGLEDPALKN